ncbi:hypothetical protein [Prevotella sp. KH2C16]|uniref:hypothetical protein n=1 Tax=Prevotella sp. KH2C16 TaxID=1855325 RepID=UPI0008ED7C4C|nr:hypothetical protein [Prevotella sp. KH2C16]SFF93733.1 hypothetical protein SAMN05216383_102189 [Prevotella sp. KH2C16]
MSYKNMKKIILSLMLMFAFTLTASSQEIYKEVRRIMQQEEAIKNDVSKSLDARKVATFKWDAIYYIIMKAAESSDFTAYQLGQQTDAMIDFVNRYINRLSNEKKKSQREIIMARYKSATTHNALFHDMDKDIIYGYVDNDKFLTQFSLDTDWVSALQEVKDNNY